MVSAYADNGLRSDGKKRYPIGTKAQVTSAVVFFGRKANRDKYSADDAKKIDDRIDAAKKKFGIDKAAAVVTATAPILGAVAPVVPPVDLSPINKAIETLTGTIEAQKAAALIEKAEAKSRHDALLAKLEASESAAAADRVRADKATQTLETVLKVPPQQTAAGGLATASADPGAPFVAPAATGEHVDKAAPTPRRAPPGLSALGAAIHAQITAPTT